MKIIYHDKDIAVVKKEAGELSQGDKNGSESLIDIISRELKSEVFPIHRLDRPVSGIMVYALNKKAASELSRQLQTDGIGFSKHYTAVVSGELPEKSGILEDYIYKDGQKNKSFVCSSERKGVKRASLEYTVTDIKVHPEYGKISFVSITLHTGRTHQIRVQLSSRGCPILGDGKYGSRIKLGGRIALCATRLEFIHPTFSEDKADKETFEISYLWEF